MLKNNLTIQPLYFIIIPLGLKYISRQKYLNIVRENTLQAIASK